MRGGGAGAGHRSAIRVGLGRGISRRRKVGWDGRERLRAAPRCVVSPPCRKPKTTRNRRGLLVDAVLGWRWRVGERSDGGGVDGTGWVGKVPGHESRPVSLRMTAASHPHPRPHPRPALFRPSGHAGFIGRTRRTARQHAGSYRRRAWHWQWQWQQRRLQHALHCRLVVAAPSLHVPIGAQSMLTTHPHPPCPTTRAADSCHDDAGAGATPCMSKHVLRQERACATRGRSRYDSSKRTTGPSRGGGGERGIIRVERVYVLHLRYRVPTLAE